MARVKLQGIQGTDTESKLILSLDGTPLIIHDAITRARFVFADSDAALDSQTYPGAWDFSHSDYVLVRLGRGDLARGHYRGKLVVHDVDHPNGQGWLDTELEIVML